MRLVYFYYSKILYSVQAFQARLLEYFFQITQFTCIFLNIRYNGKPCCRHYIHLTCWHNLYNYNLYTWYQIIVCNPYFYLYYNDVISYIQYHPICKLHQTILLNETEYLNKYESQFKVQLQLCVNAFSGAGYIVMSLICLTKANIQDIDLFNGNVLVTLVF